MVLKSTNKNLIEKKANILKGKKRKVIPSTIVIHSYNYQLIGNMFKNLKEKIATQVTKTNQSIFSGLSSPDTVCFLQGHLDKKRKTEFLYFI